MVEALTFLAVVGGYRLRRLSRACISTLSPAHALCGVFIGYF